MSSVKDKIKLCSTEMNGLIVENINGVPFYERYIEFENTIKKHITDRKYHNMFAQPVFNTTNNMLDWYVSPEFSNAIRLSELRDKLYPVSLEGYFDLASTSCPEKG